MRNVVLVGFMGTGKTTVGEALAHALGLPHVDLDEAIVAGEESSIAAMFAEKGEGYFRDLESQYLNQLLISGPHVLTTGGGAVLRPQNVQAMLEKGTVIALHATEAELIKRLETDTQRPLLAQGVAERVRVLLAERAGAYDFAPIQVDTTGKSLPDIVKEISMQLIEGESYRTD